MRKPLTYDQLVERRISHLRHYKDYDECAEAEQKLIEGEPLLLSIELHEKLIKHFERIGLVGIPAQNGFCKLFRLE
jgi:hypothetical protein